MEQEISNLRGQIERNLARHESKNGIRPDGWALGPAVRSVAAYGSRKTLDLQTKPKPKEEPIIWPSEPLVETLRLARSDIHQGDLVRTPHDTVGRVNSVSGTRVLVQISLGVEYEYEYEYEYEADDLVKEAKMGFGGVVPGSLVLEPTLSWGIVERVCEDGRAERKTLYDQVLSGTAAVCDVLLKSTRIPAI